MSVAYKDRTHEELKQELASAQAAYEALKAQNLKLNMARGKPGKEQLDLVSDLLTILHSPEQCMCDGMDVRNYGELSGLPSAKRLFADILGCKPEECFVGGSASLTLMYDAVSKAVTHGMLHSEKPWCKLDSVKWLCPAPGYDRHFKITQSFGFEMITVPMTPTGPDMDLVEQLVKDPAVKGMWCVPKYSNPDGIIYSDETVHRIANMKPAAKDFMLMWDNAYCVHEFDGDFVPFEDILTLCREAGNPDMVFEFASTSKITFPGAGISAIACSENSMKYMCKRFSTMIISYDKMNQLRHVRFLKNKAGVLAHMAKHRRRLVPCFDAVKTTFAEELTPCGNIAHWTNPKGGYFISLYVMPGCAKRVAQLCKDCGLTLTGAGSAYPYHKDPDDSHLRIAPTYPSLTEVETASALLCVCVRLAVVEKLLADQQ